MLFLLRPAQFGAQPIGPVFVSQLGRDQEVAPVAQGESDGLMKSSDAPVGEQHNRSLQALTCEVLRIMACCAR